MENSLLTKQQMTNCGHNKTPDNSTYRKLAVQWLNEALCFVSSFTYTGFIFNGIREPFGVVVSESFRLRNRQLLVAANRQDVKKLRFSES